MMAMSTKGPSMSKQDKFIAGFLIFQAVAGAATIAWVTLVSGPSTGLLLIFVPVILAALVAGIGSFRGLAWARKLGLLVFIVQVPSFETPWFFYKVWLGVHLNIMFGWVDAARVGINFLALGMLIWGALRLRRKAFPPGTSPEKQMAESAPGNQ